MQRIDTGRSTICWDKGGAQPLNWDLADKYCDDNFRATLCSLVQWRAVVCKVGVANPGRSWTTNTTGTASFATISGCTGDSLGSFLYTNAMLGPCCLEYMKY